MEKIIRGRVEELLRTAREIDISRRLASRESKPEPHSEYYAKRVLEYHSRQEEISTDWERIFFVDLSYMEIAVELEKDRKKIETIAKKLVSRNSNPEPQSEDCARLALSAHKEGDSFLILMGYHLKVEDIKGRLKELLNTAREIDIARRLASRQPKSEPHSEFYAKVALKAHSEYLRQEGDERKLKSDFNLGCMEIALELEKDRKKLEMIAEELVLRNSNSESYSEDYAKRALRAYREGDRFLIYMGYHLEVEDIL